jgi:thiol-disulfide isomerase/thioredoxin
MASGSAVAQAAPPAAAVDRRPRTHMLVGRGAPVTDLALAGSGRRLTNAAFARRTTIVQFWGLWCPDCLADVDHVAELVRRLERERGIGFVSVHTRGRYGRWGALEPFFAEKGYRFPVAVDDDGAAYRAWQIGWVPSFLIVDRAGVIRDYTTDLVAGNGIGVEGLIARARAVASRRPPARP